MGKIKSVIERIIQYAGIFGSLLLFLLVISNNKFESEGMSVLLVGITVLFIYAIFRIFFNLNKKIKTTPNINSGIFVFGFSMVSIVAVFIRMIAFMLIDVDIMGKRALITYTYTVICFIVIYLGGRLLGSHKSGLASSVIYALFCPFDIYPAMDNLHSGGTKTELIIDYAGTLFIILSFIIAMLAIKAEKSKNALILSTVCGSALGICVILQKNAVIAAVCMIIMFMLTKKSYKYVGRDAMRSLQYKPYKYVLFFLLGFSVFTAASIVAVYSVGLLSLIPEWFIYLKKFDCAVAVFRYADEMLTSMWGGIYFERNLFITYVSLLLYLFVFVSCAAGCNNAVKSKNTKTVFAITFPMAISIAGIFECGGVSYIYNAIPLVLILAGYGVTSVFNYVISPEGGSTGNKIILPRDIEEQDIERIEKKYILPKGCAAVCLASYSDSEDDACDNLPDDTEDLCEESDEEDCNNKKSENVVSGNDLDSMLDNLYGYPEGESKDNAVENDKKDESSDVILFK
ncbi:MAG: hypothetical protein IJZ94_05195 [Clostridia bacterium]|nr:hypothetical protein [Clostridia bacterium]